MKRMTTAFLLALLLLPVFSAPRGACAEAPVLPSQDPNAPNISNQERLDRQRALIKQRIAARQKMMEEQQKREGKQAQGGNPAGKNAQASTATLALAVELNNELEQMRSRLNELMNAAGPLLREAYARPAPRAYKVEAQVKLEEGEEMQLLGYGEDEVMFSAPLIRVDPVSKIRLVGSIELTAKLQPLDDAGKVQVDYRMTMDTPMVQTYNNGSGKPASSGQMTFRSGSSGKAALKAGEAKEIVRVGANAIKLTVTPE